MNKTVQYYTDYDEENRLRRHPVEFYATTHILDNYINSGDSILDVATGTGTYAIYYAQNGCQVTAEDITPRHIELMQEELNELKYLDIACQVGDARNLEHYEKESFDSVLCMGPIYHLDKDDSNLCIQQCLNVLKKDGILVIAYINKYKGYDKDHYADEVFFNSPGDIESLVEPCGIEKICNIPVDGPVFSSLEEYLKSSPSNDEIDLWLQSNADIFEDDDWKISTCHGLYLGRKR